MGEITMELEFRLCGAWDSPEVNASHVAYMSHPKETDKLIEEAATSAHVN
jgi:hypothetical protein